MVVSYNNCEVLDLTEKPFPSSVSIAPHCPTRGDMSKVFQTRSDVDSVVAGIPPAEAGAWPSSTRLISNNKPNEDGW